MLVMSALVPPRLIIGNGWPVTGPIPTDTIMLISAWQVIINANPITISIAA